MGKLKIDMLSNLLMFKRKCRLLKWEHAILEKHKITLYKHRCDVITSMKVTENVLRYLKFKSKGMNIANEAEQKVEKELAGIEIVRYISCIFRLKNNSNNCSFCFIRLIHKKREGWPGVWTN